MDGEPTLVFIDGGLWSEVESGVGDRQVRVPGVRGGVLTMVSLIRGLRSEAESAAGDQGVKAVDGVPGVGEGVLVGLLSRAKPAVRGRGVGGVPGVLGGEPFSEDIDMYVVYLCIVRRGDPAARCC